MKVDRCEYCGAPFEQNGQGRPRQFCKQSHANRLFVMKRGVVPC
jgi:ribosomal protein L34E